MRVLVADDDAVHRRVVESALAGWGYKVLTCSDGSEAWRLLSDQDPPELALLDWLMAGVDGLELCRRVRGSSNPLSSYIILLTARGGGDDVVAGLETGADDYLTKPFDREQLRARVRVGSRMVGLQRRRVEQETLRYVKQLEIAVDQLRDSRRRLVVAQEEARKSVARELHGPVQTQLLLMGTRLSEVRDMIGTSPGDAEKELERVVTEMDSLRENEIRQLSHRLHPSVIDLGLSAGIRSLRDHYERNIGVGVDIAPDVVERDPVGSSTIPLDVRLGLYRVAEEALANVIKHAQATRAAITVSLVHDGSWIRLMVSDNGRGFQAEPTRRGLGMVTMEDYVEALGGALEVDTTLGRGTRIIATAPLSSSRRGCGGGADLA